MSSGTRQATGGYIGLSPSLAVAVERRDSVDSDLAVSAAGSRLMAARSASEGLGEADIVPEVVIDALSRWRRIAWLFDRQGGQQEQLYQLAQELVPLSAARPLAG